MSSSPIYLQHQTDSIEFQHPNPKFSPQHQIPEPTENYQDGTDLKLHNDIYGPDKSAHHKTAIPPHNPFFQSTVGNHPVLPASSSWPLDGNPEFSASEVQEQLPFSPECPFELEIFQQWKSGHPTYQQASAPSEIPNFAAWTGNTDAAGEPMSMTDSGVDFSVPPEHQDANQECPSSSIGQNFCTNPNKCELSPDMAEAMHRFSVPHICEYEQAKKLLVDKIVNKVLQNAAPRIMALLEEELQKREEEMDMEMEEYDEDMDSDFEAKL
ncbi:hypothetical protein B0T09DRAFT_384453 [Sordaria sp. MPI-SDFR-AT-0083]|nr:hypothetical protein B0T09DRAFT_384453 [Sordaria sp. MPI-SDFR-AT-0083]